MTPDSLIEKEFRLGDFQKKALRKMGIKTIRDLLYHFPARYGDVSEMTSIGSLIPGQKAVIFGKISGLKTSKAFRKKIPMAEAKVEDETGRIKIIWFHQAYLAKMIPDSAFVRVEGKVSERRDELYFSNPKIETVAKVPLAVGDSLFGKEGEKHHLYPVYPESRGVTSNWLYHAVQKIFNSGILDSIRDPIPEEILKKYNLPCFKSAMVWAHLPQKSADALSARKRFAFEEVFFIQLEKQKAKKEYRKNASFIIEKKDEDIQKFLDRFPFKPTKAQMKALSDIISDFKKGQAMSRLLEGDVGSGKTMVAAAAAYTVVTTRPKGQDFGNLQVAYMCPTEILAGQHFESFIKYFSHLPINIGLITGSGCRKFPSKVNPAGWTDISRTQLLKWSANGEIPILIGTHSLIQKTVKFKNLAFAIIDEQHRFGTHQRYSLVRRKSAEQTLINADNKRMDSDELLYKDLTFKIRGAAFNVKKNLGSGHKELIYQRALEEEFKKVNLQFSREKKIPILYNGKNIGLYQPDFVVDNKIIVELKALPFLGNPVKAQTWNYLKGSEYKLALIINFGSRELEIERLIYENARKNKSAFVPHSSASVPHLLSMTATPIPRTLALTIYGDLDLTLLDEMPAGRKPIITEIVLQKDREAVYEKIRAEIKAGRQAYVICPRIDEPDPTKEMALNVKSVKEEALRLQEKVFPEFEIDILHSKMTPDEKERAMNDFKNGKTHILVATSVVEVGVNVPNATIIILEGAERFGLAQLHQLRGRVIRSTDQAYCYVFAETKTEKTLQRLKALQTAKNGFELAEFDLKFRGAGELYGKKQWGLSDIAMEALKNLKMVEAARKEATELLEKDENFENYPLVREELAKRKSEEIHFE